MPEMDHSEQWKPVKGYEGIYAVSDNGNVRRESRARRAVVGHILRPAKNPDGYLHVNLYDGKSIKCASVHRLVLEAFVARAGSDDEANHHNGIRDDNRLSNLEWASRLSNMRHSYRILGRDALSGEQNGNSKLTQEIVDTIRDQHVSGKSCMEIARNFSLNRSTVWRICTNRAWAKKE